MRLFDVVLVLVLLGCSAAPEEELPAEHAAGGGGTSSGVGGGSGAGGTFGGSMSDAGRAGFTSSAGSSAGGRTATAGTAGNTAFDGAMSGPTTHPWDWAGIVGTGQSLSVGAEAYNIVLDTQPFKNLKLALNGANVTLPPYDANDAALSVVPLVEPIRGKVFGFPEPYPTNIYGETPHTAMADQISSLFLKDTGEDYITVHSAVGESGMAIDVIGKNATPDAGRGHAYAASLFEVTALKRLAAAAGKTYGVGGIILTHGETDWGNPDYESKVYQLYTDYNADLRAITGQIQKVPLFLSQQQTCPGDNSSAASLIAQWKSGVDHPGEVICVGPKYQYPYANDHVHLLPAGYDHARRKVRRGLLREGRTWARLAAAPAHFSHARGSGDHGEVSRPRAATRLGLNVARDASIGAHRVE